MEVDEICVVLLNILAISLCRHQYQCSVCDLNLEIIEKFQANKAVRLVVSHWKSLHHSPMEISGNFQKFTPEF